PDFAVSLVSARRDRSGLGDVSELLVTTTFLSGLGWGMKHKFARRSHDCLPSGPRMGGSASNNRNRSCAALYSPAVRRRFDLAPVRSRARSVWCASRRFDTTPSSPRRCADASNLPSFGRARDVLALSSRRLAFWPTERLVGLDRVGDARQL